VRHGGGGNASREKATLSILECNIMGECSTDEEEIEPKVLVFPIMIPVDESLLTAILMLEQTDIPVLPVRFSSAV
jgi:hypothetical protein